MAGEKIIDAIDLIKIAQERLLDKKGEHVQVLDVRELSSITDYFLIAGGSSLPQLNAMAKDLESALKQHGSRCYRKSGSPESGWIILDYVDVVIHLMSAEAREYYALEELWSDAPVIQTAI